MKIISSVNINESYKLFSKSLSYNKQGYCYNNCINILAKEFLDEFTKGLYRIAYCYVGGKNHLMVRHCVILNTKDEVIDTALFYRYNKEEVDNDINSNEIKYYIIKEFDKDTFLYVFEFIDSQNSDLKKTLHEYDVKACEYFLKNNFEINDRDYEKYIKR